MGVFSDGVGVVMSSNCALAEWRWSPHLLLQRLPACEATAHPGCRACSQGRCHCWLGNSILEAPFGFDINNNVFPAAFLRLREGEKWSIVVQFSAMLVRVVHQLYVETDPGT